MDFKKLLNSLKFSINYNNDIPRQFIKKILDSSRSNAMYIAEQIQLALGVNINVTKTNSTETAIAIIGSSLGLLQNGSALMSSKQGKKIELLCKDSIKNDFDLSSEESKIIISGIDQYLKAYEQSWAIKTNPFNKPAGILIMEFMGEKASEAFQKDNPQILNPLIHQIIMDFLALMIIEPMKLFKK